jgi:hypothetical protein
MSFYHPSFERSPKIRHLWIWLVTSLFLLASAGCSGPPVFNVLGSYFPSWLVCLTISIGLTFVAHAFVTTKKLADELWPLSIVYSALLCLFSCTLWLVFFA